MHPISTVYLILIWMIFLPLTWAGEAPPEEPELPTAVIQTLDRYDAAVIKAQEAYRRDVNRAKQAALRELERQQKSVTRKGDLEQALAIKAKIDAVTEQNPGGLEPVDILGRKIKQEREAATLKKVTDTIEGRWQAVSGISGLSRTFTFRANGKVSWERGNHLWSVKDGRVLIYDEGEPPIWVFPLPVKKVKWEARHIKGTLWPFTKVEK